VSIINSLEPRLGPWAVPGLLKITAALQAVVFLLAKQNPDVLDHLSLIPALVLRGEVWRLISFVFLPPTLNIFWIIISTMFLVWMSDLLEQAWGRFRLNVYFFSCVFLLIVAGFLLPQATGLAPELLFASLFLALAALAPDVELRVYLLIPVKMKYLAWLEVARLVWLLFVFPSSWLSIVAVMIPFGLWAAPPLVASLRHGAVARARRRRFERDSRSDEDVFHRCAGCGATEKSDAHAEFRVTADGREFCVACLAKRV
jgi:hypothetical protein